MVGITRTIFAAIMRIYIYINVITREFAIVRTQARRYTLYNMSSYTHTSSIGITKLILLYADLCAWHACCAFLKFSILPVYEKKKKLYRVLQHVPIIIS